jgi:hypothetical protein
MDTNVSEEHAASIFRRECFTTLSASRVSNGRMIVNAGLGRI